MLDVGKEYIVNIENLGYEGEGIGKIDGYPIFITGALIGEEVRVEITKAKKKFAFGKLIEVIKESKDRVLPKCKIYDKCGGCTLKHLNYEGQLDFKYNRVRDCISKIAKLDPSIVKHTIGMKDGYRYRNKAQYQVGMNDGKINIGFYSEKSYKIIDMDECLISNKESEEIVRIIRAWMQEYSIMPVKIDGVFCEKGLLKNIVVRKGFKTNEIMVVLVTLDKEIPHINELIEKINSKFSGVKSIIQNINPQNTKWVMGEKCITLYGEDYICDYIGKYKFNISALSFFQVNPHGTEVLYSKALEYAGLTGDEIVFDAYCGTGTIALFLSQNAKKVYGVEILGQAIDNAKLNAVNNNVDNSEFLVGKSEEVIPNLIDEGIIPDVIVLDPPRKGCDIKLLEAITKSAPKRVVYVSCDPSTLARDLKYLCENGYEAHEVQAVDMFPMTKHVECCVLLKKAKK